MSGTAAPWEGTPPTEQTLKDLERVRIECKEDFAKGKGAFKDGFPFDPYQSSQWKYGWLDEKRAMGAHFSQA